MFSLIIGNIQFLSNSNKLPEIEYLIMIELTLGGSISIIIISMIIYTNYLIKRNTTEKTRFLNIIPIIIFILFVSIVLTIIIFNKTIVIQ